MEAGAAYQEAVASGRYARPTGLLGKYDNVRLYWEDWVTAYFITPFLEELVADRKRRGRGLSILDLGCGSGDGYELLAKLPASRVAWEDHCPSLLGPEAIGYYLGIDLNEELLAEGRASYGVPGKVEFARANFCEGLPSGPGGRGFDLYFTSYGTLSHCDDAELEQLLVNIAAQAPPGAIVVGDWLGRYSYEWQSLWTHEVEQVPTINYVISYLAPDANREKQPYTSFPLRLMSRPEVTRVVERAGKRGHAGLRILSFFDRSVFVGRHMDTRQYNAYALPLRRAVNSLLEPGVRTDLATLKLECHPREGFPDQNRVLAGMADNWNRLVDLAAALLGALEAGADPKGTELPAGVPAPLAEGLVAAARAAERLAPDARAWCFERQLALALRGLEIEGQVGEGLGHGLVAILRVEK
ncbi:MAG: class I SAM-dependent methyltransferase [Clostridia bacterium]|nr:class I SAM-dependent methyltransferase [Clostridia bacterium]MDH7574014.1 class I SAM-dependent methyltransferase [Clostridia bacterium]